MNFDIPLPHMSGAGSLEPPNIISLLHHHYPELEWLSFLYKYENIFFAAVAGIFLSLVFVLGTRTLRLVPGRVQNMLEYVIESLQDFYTAILGPQGKSFVPFIGTLFLFILSMNMMGLVPLLKASTTDLNQTLALAICVFFTVQYTAISRLGPLKYLDHLAGQPRETIMFILAPFLFCLFILLDVLVPPITLSLRLFGNVTGGDTLLAAFQDMATRNLLHPDGIMSIVGGTLAFVTILVITMLLVLLDTIQALVFSLLSTIYLVMVLPHEEHTH